MKRYAQINKNGYVISDSYLSDIVNLPNMILLEKGFDLKNKRWNGMQWEEYTPEPTPEPQLTETEQAILDTTINVDYLVCMKELEI
ncbi:flagellar basal-body rod protein [Anaerotignum faecicola]|jgi:hypothetical protein